MPQYERSGLVQQGSLNTIQRTTTSPDPHIIYTNLHKGSNYKPYTANLYNAPLFIFIVYLRFT